MSDWTPPGKLWAIFAHTNTDDYFILAVDRESKIRAGQYARQEVVSYVPEFVVDALREENARLKAKGLDDFTVTGDEYDRLLAERDALRARVEELGAGLRDLLTLIGDLRSEDYVAGWEADPPVNRARALLSGGSQEPRPDTDETCPDCGGGASPAEVLAALDDDAREQMVEQIRDVLLGLDTTTPTRFRERDARAVVDAICGVSS